MGCDYFFIFFISDKLSAAREKLMDIGISSIMQLERNSAVL